MMRRKIKEIIIHCSATREGQNIDAATIDEWHKERGWSGIGYHYVIKIDGTTEYGRPVEKSGAHCKGHNTHSIGICYIGGCEQDLSPKDTRTEPQKIAMFALLLHLKRMHPEATIHGHRDFSSKACPSFDATKEYKRL
jgi:N-acetylmuramoyl-L-alanine amidase